MSTIESQFTEVERRVLAMYRDPAKHGIGRAARLSAQYALGGALFLCVAIMTGNPWWSVAIYAMFLAWMGIRLLGARRLSRAMPSIIAKYESRIEELERELQSGGTA